ncbi:hypothetical protein HDV01_005725 [Terramyces sp. JEL0728]|nr:hypothetical protein HDV01_005725 [Terramyces sp. JEL0728]
MSGPLVDLSGMKNLLTFSVMYNSFAQNSFPSWIFKMPQLESVVLDGNSFPGSVFPQLSTMTNLYTFSASYCNITGSITSDIKNMANLTYLYLDHNDLTGSIPQEITLLKELSAIDLSNNHLDPTVPAGVSTMQYYDPKYFTFGNQTGTASSGGLKGTSLYIVIGVAVLAALGIAGAAFYLYSVKKSKSSQNSNTQPNQVEPYASQNIQSDPLSNQYNQPQQFQQPPVQGYQAPFVPQAQGYQNSPQFSNPAYPNQTYQTPQASPTPSQYTNLPTPTPSTQTFSSHPSAGMQYSPQPSNYTQQYISPYQPAEPPRAEVGQLPTIAQPQSPYANLMTQHQPAEEQPRYV